MKRLREYTSGGGGGTQIRNKDGSPITELMLVKANDSVAPSDDQIPSALLISKDIEEVVTEVNKKANLDSDNIYKGNQTITGNLYLNTVDSSTGSFTVYTNTVKTNSISINDNSSKPRIQWTINNVNVVNLELSADNNSLKFNNKLKALDPTENDDLSTKKYVDDKVTNITTTESVFYGATYKDKPLYIKTWDEVSSSLTLLNNIDFLFQTTFLRKKTSNSNNYLFTSSGNNGTSPTEGSGIDIVLLSNNNVFLGINALAGFESKITKLVVIYSKI
ncbi:MAG: hypothetical protein ACRCXE_03295 [Metamycoplasmataceae bacterium]